MKKKSFINATSLFYAVLSLLLIGCNKDTLAPMSKAPMSNDGSQDLKFVSKSADGTLHFSSAANIHNVSISLTAEYNHSSLSISVFADLVVLDPNPDIRGLYELKIDISKANKYDIAPTSGGYTFSVGIPNPGETETYVIKATAYYRETNRAVASTSVTVYVRADGGDLLDAKGEASYKMDIHEPDYNGGPYRTEFSELVIDFNSVRNKDINMLVFYIPYSVYIPTDGSYRHIYYKPAQLLYSEPLNKEKMRFPNRPISFDLPASYNPYGSHKFVVLFSTNFTGKCLSQPLFSSGETIINYVLNSSTMTNVPFLPGLFDIGYPIRTENGVTSTKIDALDVVLKEEMKYWVEGGYLNTECLNQ